MTVLNLTISIFTMALVTWVMLMAGLYYTMFIESNEEALPFILKGLFYWFLMFFAFLFVIRLPEIFNSIDFSEICN